MSTQCHSNLYLFDLVANSYEFVQTCLYTLVQFTHPPMRAGFRGDVFFSHVSFLKLQIFVRIKYMIFF